MREIEVTGGAITQVDDDVYDYLVQFRWRLSPREKHVVRRVWDKGIRRTIMMHRVILGLGKDDGSETDHIDRNKLNNQRSNLRICTTAQNQWNAGMRKDNSSGYKGVWKQKNRWTGAVKHNGVFHRIGSHKNIIEAVRARDRKALELHGEFAFTNFPKEQYQSRRIEHDYYLSGVVF